MELNYYCVLATILVLGICFLIYLILVRITSQFNFSASVFDGVSTSKIFISSNFKFVILGIFSVYITSYLIFKSWTRQKLYEFVSQKYDSPIQTRAWQGGTPAVLYESNFADQFSEKLLNYQEGLLQYDGVLWNLDLVNGLKFKPTGMMVQPNLIFHGMAKTTHKRYSFE